MAEPTRVRPDRQATSDHAGFLDVDIGVWDAAPPAGSTDFVGEGREALEAAERYRFQLWHTADEPRWPDEDDQE